MKSMEKFSFTMVCFELILCVLTEGETKASAFRCTTTVRESHKSLQTASISPSTNYSATFEETDPLKSTVTSQTETVTPVHPSPAVKKKAQFVFTFPPLKCMEDVATQVFVATRIPNEHAIVEISFPFSDSLFSFSLGESTGHFHSIPTNILLQHTDVGSKVNKTVIVASDKLIVAYGHQHCTSVSNWRATAFRVRPLSELGNDYWLLTYQSVGISQAAVVADEDNTSLNISMPSLSERVNLKLDKYESYFFGGEYDASGTHMLANKPVLVMAGNSADKIPGRNPGHDSFMECLSDVTTWGRYFSVVSLMNASSNYIMKIISAENHTTTRWTNGDDVTEVLLRKGEVHEKDVILHNNSILEIHSSNPILVAQFSNGFISSGADESMVLVPPLSHEIEPKVITFPVFSLPAEENVKSFLTVWISAGGFYDNITLDQQEVVWREIGKDKYNTTIVQTSLSVGSHTMSYVGNSSIRAIVSSYHTWISYSYPLT